MRTSFFGEEHDTQRERLCAYELRADVLAEAEEVPGAGLEDLRERDRAGQPLLRVALGEAVLDQDRPPCGVQLRRPLGNVLRGAAAVHLDGVEE